MKVEVCVSSLESALLAEAAGADRLELCSELAVGGITPSPGLLKTVRENIRIPVHVLIRPRSGNFVYSEQEFGQMLFDIAYCRSLGFKGFALGCLLEDKSLDMDGMEVLIGEAGTSHLTFHRAFDRIVEWKKALNQLESLGVNTILTSGQAQTALKGLSRLEELVKSTRCGIIPGGGIRPSNLHAFLGKGFEAVHLSALPKVPEEAPSGLPLNAPRLLREGFPILPDAKLIAEVVDQIRTNPSLQGEQS